MVQIKRSLETKEITIDRGYAILCDVLSLVLENITTHTAVHVASDNVLTYVCTYYHKSY